MGRPFPMQSYENSLAEGTAACTFEVGAEDFLIRMGGERGAELEQFGGCEGEHCGCLLVLLGCCDRDSGRCL